jgi:hypothetical protein
MTGIDPNRIYKFSLNSRAWHWAAGRILRESTKSADLLRKSHASASLGIIYIKLIAVIFATLWTVCHQVYHPRDRLRPVSAEHLFELPHQRRPPLELGRVLRPHHFA